MTFRTRTRAGWLRRHHQPHLMAGIFQRPSSICIFKTLLMAWEDCILSVLLGTTLPTSSPTLRASASASPVPRGTQKSPDRGTASPSPTRDHLETPRQGGLGELWLATRHGARTPIR